MADNWIERMMREQAKKSETTPVGQRTMMSRVATSPIAVGDAMKRPKKPKK